jgi:hypothetical protein
MERHNNTSFQNYALGPVLHDGDKGLCEIGTNGKLLLVQLRDVSKSEPLLFNGSVVGRLTLDRFKTCQPDLMLPPAMQRTTSQGQKY